MVTLFPEPQELLWTGINLLLPVGFIVVVVGIALWRRRAFRSLEQRVSQLEAQVEALQNADPGRHQH